MELLCPIADITSAKAASTPKALPAPNLTDPHETVALSGFGRMCSTGMYQWEGFAFVWPVLKFLGLSSCWLLSHVVVAPGFRGSSQVIWIISPRQDSGSQT